MHDFVMRLSLLSPRDETPGICGAFDFSGECLVKISAMGPKIWSNQIKYPHLGEVISLNFMAVVGIYFFFIYSFDALCNPRKINKSSILSDKTECSCLNLTETMCAVYHVELYKSCISSDTISYNFLKQKKNAPCSALRI